MRNAIGILTILLLIGTVCSPAMAQDGWRAARKTTPAAADTVQRPKTKLSAPVRLTSYQREVPTDTTTTEFGPTAKELKTAQLQDPLKSQTQERVNSPISDPIPVTNPVPATNPVPVTQPAPQTVYYSPSYGNYTNSGCYCAPQTQPAYTTYYGAQVQPYSTVGTTSYTTFRPLLNLTPTPAQQYVGQGIFGQPKVYVPGQPILNVLRYISP